MYRNREGTEETLKSAKQFMGMNANLNRDQCILNYYFVLKVCLSICNACTNARCLNISCIKSSRKGNIIYYVGCTIAVIKRSEYYTAGIPRTLCSFSNPTGTI